MKAVTDTYNRTYRVRGSKFIGFLFPAVTTDSFENQLTDVVRLYPTATHHCYAWRIGIVNTEDFTQDDGEPSGTAGLPILNKLKSAELVNSGLIVARYFGGTKLGKSGLTEAYGYTAELCIDDADLKSILQTRIFRIRYSYDKQNLIDIWKNNYKLIEKEADYMEEVTITFACPIEFSKDFLHDLQNSKHLLTFFNELGNGFELI